MDVENVEEGFKTDEVIELGRNINGYKLLMVGQREQLPRAEFTDKHMEEEGRWRELSQVEDVGEARRSAASQRQLEVNARQVLL